MSYAARIRRSSSSLCRLRVASTMRTTLVPSARECLLLQPPQVRATAHGEVEERVELRPVERHTLCCALHLDETTIARADDVHVGLRSDVLLVTEVEPRRTLDHTDRNCGHRRHQGLADERTALSQPRDRV